MKEAIYKYYKPETRGLDQEGLLEDLSTAQPGDVVLLHACAHNPTGDASYSNLNLNFGGCVGKLCGGLGGRRCLRGLPQ